MIFAVAFVLLTVVGSWTICDRLTPLVSHLNCDAKTRWTRYESKARYAPLLKSEELSEHCELVGGRMVLNASSRPRSCDARALKVVAMGRQSLVDQATCLPNGLTFTEASETATDNFGNLVWLFGARSLLSPNDNVIIDDGRLHKSPCHMRGFVDAYVVSEANLLQREFEYRPGSWTTLSLTRSVEELDVPTLVVGLGVQTTFASRSPSKPWGEVDIGGDAIPKPLDVVLHDEQHALLDAIEQRAPQGYAVRGNITAEVANVRGRRKAVALGCPSFMLSPNPCLGASLQKQLRALANTPADKTSKLKIAVLLPAHHAPILTRQLLLVMRAFPDSFIVVQTNADYRMLKVVRDTYQLAVNDTRVFYFYNIQEWRRKLQEVDLVFGCRIHGSMMGIYAGRPTLTIANDPRILELVETMMMPHKAIYDLSPAHFDLMGLVSDVAAEFDGKAFDRNRARVAQEYMLLFDSIDVKVSASVRDIAAGCPTHASAYGD